MLGISAHDGGVAPQQAEQKADSSSQQPPRFRVEANFVRVDAYPLKDGKPLLGLKAEDFEIFEDGALQKIETFEHVAIRPADPGQLIDPGNQRAAEQAVANPRNRVFVIFLDTNHVFTESGVAINRPLVSLLDRILGPDDLVAIMTPAMAPADGVRTQDAGHRRRLCANEPDWEVRPGKRQPRRFMTSAIRRLNTVRWRRELIAAARTRDPGSAAGRRDTPQLARNGHHHGDPGMAAVRRTRSSDTGRPRRVPTADPARRTERTLTTKIRAEGLMSGWARATAMPIGGGSRRWTQAVSSTS